MSLYSYCRQEKAEAISHVFATKIRQKYTSFDQTAIEHYVDLYLKDIIRFFRTRVVHRRAFVSPQVLFNKFMLWLYDSAVEEIMRILVYSGEVIRRFRQTMKKCVKQRLFDRPKGRVTNFRKFKKTKGDMHDLIRRFAKLKIRSQHSDSQSQHRAALMQHNSEQSPDFEADPPSVSSEGQTTQVINGITAISISQATQETQNAQLQSENGGKVKKVEELGEGRIRLYKKLAFLLACPEQYNSQNYINFDSQKVDPWFYSPEYD